MPVFRDGPGYDVQAFAPDRIVNVTANVAMPVSDILLFAPNSDTSYYLNGDSSKTADIVAGTCRGITQRVNSITFTTDVKLEIQSR